MATPTAETPPLRHFIMGTAGHVDHGKTELVRALTGVDTDRLKEEKARGISIELGFAPLRLDDGTVIGIVDVPGHERFVKQMVAGAGGIDLAILLIAADEGVMPQTREHMEVLVSLRVAHGAVVISKCDLADADTRALLADEIASLTAGTFLEGAPVVATSAKTGEGIDTLRDTLQEIAAKLEARPTSGPFRLAVDRVFHRKGIGVVITGSCYSGTVGPGDALELLPGRRDVRVRELQSFGAKRSTGVSGERLAVALQGVKLDEVHRGDMLCARDRFAETTVIDARVHLGRYDRFELKNRERIRLHHGAREVLGRVILLEADTLSSEATALVQILLEQAIVCAPGDDFVLRKYSPARVIGGGTVIDAAPPRRKRFDASSLDAVRVREKGDPRDVVMATLEGAGVGGVPVATVDASVRDTLCEAGTAVEVGGYLFDARALTELSQQIHERVAQHLEANPLSWGFDKEELRGRVAFPHSAQQFNRVLDWMAAGQSLWVRGSRVRVGTPEPALDAALERKVEALAAAIAEHGVAFASRKELKERSALGESFFDALQYLNDAGRVAEIGDEGVIDAGALDRVIDALARLFGENEEITVGQVKEALGISRKHAVPLLEYLDSAHITRRVGNARVRGGAFPQD